jgi:hypothetical protein
VAVNESRLKTGKLTLGGAAGVGGTEFACQQTNVRVTPSHDETGDEVETLCGDKLAPDVKTSWSVAGTSIQDFDAPDGFVQYSVENNLEVVEYSWQPNAGTFKVVGTVQVRAVEIGGDINARLTTDFEWPCQDDPTFTWPAVAGATATEETASETTSEAPSETVDGPPSTVGDQDQAQVEHETPLAEGGTDDQANTTTTNGADDETEELV